MQHTLERSEMTNPERKVPLQKRDSEPDSNERWMKLSEEYLAELKSEGIPSERVKGMAMRYFEAWEKRLRRCEEVPISSLIKDFDSLPKADQVRNEHEAERLLEQLLDQLADHNIEVEICGHLPSVDVYRYVTEEIILKSDVDPKLAEMGVVTHFWALDECPDCAIDYSDIP